MTSSTVHLTGPLERRDDWRASGCTIAAALDVVGKRSSFLLLREAFYGATRFDEFVRRTEISEPAAAARLRELVGAGLLEREDYREPGQRTRPGYRLTDAGREFFPVLVGLQRWGDRWATESGDGRVALRHRGCGERVDVVVRCAAGHEVEPDDLDLTVLPRRRS
ncbi:helix-turn-helix domain-containing protein [Patulibacter brassicae]|uniref:Helix-turn-helix domain-containing protein n=1 Tax=Patulibacter brassicae TaxID=1705717 RepID=A0ABU4VQV5_9ACTN|nr:helix-turn-helix domain-containing protein [Patulibacter brassicae]MDX8153855.1 helix-turn-helix domain-containing protein [Patulibacter brassicae]